MSNIELFKSNFYQIYRNTVKEIMTSFESQRKFRLIKFVFILLIYALLIYFFVNKVINQDIHLFFNITMAFIIILSLPFFIFIYIKLFAEDLKEKCLPKLLTAFGDLNRNYSEDNFISDEELKSSNLFPIFNTVAFDDCFSGTYKNIPFKFADVNLSYNRWSGSVQNPHLYAFNGIILLLPINKNISSKTIISPKSDDEIQNKDYSKIAIIFFIIMLAIIAFTPIIVLLKPIVLLLSTNVETSKFLSEILFNGSLLSIVPLGIILYLIYHIKTRKESLKETLILEDVDFNHLYSVHSEDQTEGRYVVTPAFMERFLNLQTTFKTKNIKCSFYDNKVMFAIPTLRDAFEIGGLFRSLNNAITLEKFFNEIISIYLIIDHFKFDEKTGL